MSPAHTPLHDHDLRAALAPLAADEPSIDELAQLRRRAVRPARRAPSVRAVGTLAGATAAVGIALALLPGGGNGTDADRGSVLVAAAAVASEQTVPSLAEAPLRYAKVRWTFVDSAFDGDRVGKAHHEQLSETWVGAKWNGREITAQGRAWSTGDRELAASRAHGALGPREGAFGYGDGPLAELDPADLPETRDAIAKTLRDGIRTNRWSPHAEERGQQRPASAQDPTNLTYSILTLLVHARLNPAQRAALIDVLASDPGARDLGTVQDSEGRKGRGVEITHANVPEIFDIEHYRVIFDERSAEILEWSGTTPGDGVKSGPDPTVTVLSTGYAERVGDRP